MFSTLKLLAPALIPSWNFFDVIAGSPRIEFARLTAPDAPVDDWQEARPRPQRLSWRRMLGRLVWNARWNEALFMVSCAERLLAQPTDHSQDEIFRRIAADLADSPEGGAAWLRFRIVLVGVDGGAITRTVAFVSKPRPVATLP